MASEQSTGASWGGRFKTATDPKAQSFTASIGFDIRLYPYDIRVSIAHARMLAACGLLTATERRRIVDGLRAVERELDSGRFQPKLSDEDIHMAIERRLVEKIGRTGAKLHAARCGWLVRTEAQGSYCLAVPAQRQGHDAPPTTGLVGHDAYQGRKSAFPGETST